MELGQETVGTVLRHYQAAKNLTTEALAAEIGLSPSTFRRILSDDTVIKAGAFFTLLDALRLAPTEVAPWLPRDWFPLAAAHSALSDAIGPATRAFLLEHDVVTAPTKTELRKLQRAFARTGNVGYQQYAYLAQIFLAELAQDADTVHATAEALYQSLIALDNWGSFELQLIASIATYLPFDRLKVIFHRRLYQDRPITELDEHQVNLLFRSFLDNAIQARNAADIHTAIGWIRERQVTDTALGERALLRLCDLVTLYMAGQLADAEAMYHQLQAALRLLTNSTDNIWILVVEDLWLNLASFHIDQLEGQA